MNTPIHNKELIAAVEDLRNRKIIKQDNEIVEKTGYSKSTVSGYISGNVKASGKFLKQFENCFNIDLSDYEVNNDLNGTNKVLTGAHVTLQDHIDLLRLYNDRLFQLLSSNLGSLKEGQRTMIAYQKAWVDYEAERAAAGDPDKKAEISYKMNKLVDDILMGESLSDIQSESGRRRRE